MLVWVQDATQETLRILSKGTSSIPKLAPTASPQRPTTVKGAVSSSLLPRAPLPPTDPTLAPAGGLAKLRVSSLRPPLLADSDAANVAGAARPKSRAQRLREEVGIYRDDDPPC